MKQIIKLSELKKEAEREKSDRVSFLELLDLIDFRDDLRYK